MKTCMHNPTDRNETIAALEARLNRLERSARRWRTTVLGMGLALAAVVLVAAGPGGAPELIEARKFQVVDAGGNPMIALSSNSMGGMVLIYNNSKSPVVVAGASPAGGAMGISNRQGNPVGLMEATAVGGSILAKSNDGRDLAAIGSRGDGGALVINNAAGKNALVLRTQNNSGQLDINGAHGKPVFSALAYGLGGGMVLVDTTGTPRITMVCDDRSGVVSLFNPEGGMTWQAPNAGFMGGK